MKTPDTDRLKRLANCAMAVDALMPGGWTATNPQRIDPEAERVYRAWRQWRSRDNRRKHYPPSRL